MPFSTEVVLDEARARELIQQAERFADRVERYLREQGSL